MKKKQFFEKKKKSNQIKKADSQKLNFSTSPILNTFLQKISGIGPWVNRMNFYNGHQCGSTYNHMVACQVVQHKLKKGLKMYICQLIWPLLYIINQIYWHDLYLHTTAKHDSIKITVHTSMFIRRKVLYPGRDWLATNIELYHTVISYESWSYHVLPTCLKFYLLVIFALMICPGL